MTARCIHCGRRPRWRGSLWCLDCVVASCCARHPRCQHRQWKEVAAATRHVVGSATTP